MIKKLNSSLKQPEFQEIIRTPIESGSVGCEEMIHYKCGWISPHGTFGRQLMDKTCK
jgi:hypothetical protein